MILPRTMIRMCRKAMFRRKMMDSSGAELTGGAVLMRSLVLRRLLLRVLFDKGGQNVGVLLPPSAAGAIVNAAVTLSGRVAVNLNYSATSKIVNACIGQAGIRYVLTSRKVMDKLDLQLEAEVIYLEEFRNKITLADKAIGAMQAYLCPALVLDRICGLHAIQPDDILTIIFTSGSTGVPKGVMLTYENIGTNVVAIDHIVHPDSHDTVLGVLPFFHSFGYMVTLWVVLGLDLNVAYHFSPLDARAIGKLARQSKATIFLATPTFLRSYLRRCNAEDLSSLEVVVTGAEKLPASLSDAFEEKFGVRPVEGYGATELSPLVSVNVPPSRSLTSEVDLKEGTVGRPIPGIEAKIVHPETGEDQPQGDPGMLLIKGPNVMKGYFGQPEKTAEVVRDGWYVTGDIASIDEDGFISITGRISRFSKIGGEMVPHVRVEELIQEIVEDGDEEEILAVVTAVLDERKGERLIVVHKALAKNPEEIRQKLSETGLPSLWIPSVDSFVEVDQIPLLGSGKTDLKAVSDLAKQRFSA